MFYPHVFPLSLFCTRAHTLQSCVVVLSPVLKDQKPKKPIEKEISPAKEDAGRAHGRWKSAQPRSCCSTKKMQRLLLPSARYSSRYEHSTSGGRTLEKTNRRRQTLHVIFAQFLPLLGTNVTHSTSARTLWRRPTSADTFQFMRAQGTTCGRMAIRDSSKFSHSASADPTCRRDRAALAGGAERATERTARLLYSALPLAKACRWIDFASPVILSVCLPEKPGP
jgi:hypothetical protein